MSARKVGGGTPPSPQQATAGGRSGLSPAKTTGGGGSVTALRTVAGSAQSGTRRDLLVALRERLWGALQDDRTQPRDLSPLTLRLKEIHAEIESIDLRAGDGDKPVVDGPFDPRSV